MQCLAKARRAGGDADRGSRFVVEVPPSRRGIDRLCLHRISRPQHRRGVAPRLVAVDENHEWPQNHHSALAIQSKDTQRGTCLKGLPSVTRIGQIQRQFRGPLTGVIAEIFRINAEITGKTPGDAEYARITLRDYHDTHLTPYERDQMIIKL